MTGVLRRTLLSATVAALCLTLGTPPATAGSDNSPGGNAWGRCSQLGWGNNEKFPEGCPIDHIEYYTLTYGGELNFWDTGTVTMPSDLGNTATYSQLYALAGCGPVKGYPNAPWGTTYNYRSGYYVYDHVQKYVFTAGGTWYGVTRTTAPVCQSWTTPTPTTVPVLQYGTVQVNGPYDSTGTAMVSAAQGGTNTRKPDGVNYGVTGVPVGKTTILGDLMKARLGSSADLTKAVATPLEVWKVGVSSPALTVTTNEALDAHGRYYADNNRYFSNATVVMFTEHFADLSHIYPVATNSAGTNYWSIGSTGTYIPQVTGPTNGRFFNRFTITCNGLTRTVANPSPETFNPKDGLWGDGPDSYTADCNPNLPGNAGENQGNTLGDLMKCDVYAGVSTRPYSYTLETLDVTVWTPDPTSAEGGYWATNSIVTPVKNQTPLGWTDNGTQWVQDRPGNSFMVGGKSAAPITTASPDFFNRDDGRYDANATGDWYGVEWERPVVRVNVGPSAGVNVNDLPEADDVRWSRMWALDEHSSPVLIKDAVTGEPINDVNDYRQPYQIVTDGDAGLLDIPASDNDWVPSRDSGTGDAALNRWIGFESPGWEDTQRRAYVRFFDSQWYGKGGWTLTPYWMVTATLTFPHAEVSGITVNPDGSLSPKVTYGSGDLDRVRESYICPGQPITFTTNKVV